jgi:hypothetical protein
VTTTEARIDALHAGELATGRLALAALGEATALCSAHSSLTT